MKRDFRILTEIGNLLNKEKKEKDLSKKNLFPLNLFTKEGSFLNQESYDYINSVSPKNRIKTPSFYTIPSNQNLHKTLFNFILKYNENKAIKSSIVNDVIYQYLKTFSIYNKRKNGILMQYNQYIGYNFNSNNILLRGVDPQNNKSLNINNFKDISGVTSYNQSANNKLIKYSYKLLFYYFKSMYCLISKPTFKITPDKVTIQLFYYLNIPKFKVFKWFSILNNKLIRQKWYSLKKNINLENLHINTPINSINNSAKFKSKLNPIFYSSKEMMNSVKLSWRIKKTLFRLNKKRNKVKNILFNLSKFNL